MSATTLTQAGLERRVGPETVSRFFDDSGAGRANPTLVMECLEEAEAIALGILGKGVDALASRVRVLQKDPAALGAAYDIAAGLMGRRKPEFLTASTTSGQGSLYDAWRREAEKVLERIAAGERRTLAEVVPSGAAPVNAHVAFATSPNPPDRVFLEPSSTSRSGRRYSGSGGY